MQQMLGVLCTRDLCGKFLRLECTPDWCQTMSVSSRWLHMQVYENNPCSLLGAASVSQVRQAHFAGVVERTGREGLTGGIQL